MAAEEDARFAGICLDGHENICPAVTGSPVMRYRYFALLRAVSCFASSAGFYRPIFYCMHGKIGTMCALIGICHFEQLLFRRK